MTAVLTDSVCNSFTYYLCMFAKYCDNQLWKSKEQPCYGFPPATDEQPIQATFFALFFYFVYNGPLVKTTLEEIIVNTF